MKFDLIVHKGLVVDGSGQLAFKADIGVLDGKIAEVGTLNSSSASEVVDASDLVVAPGFIDMHSHSDYVLLVNPKAESKVRQGVTTEVIGNCGNSAAPILGHAKEYLSRHARYYGIDVDWESFDDYLSKLEKGIAVNVAPLVGHGTVR